MNTRKQRLEIGDGCSKSSYIEPTVRDTAVLLAFFNPAGFKRILNNILYVIKTLKEKNIPYFVIECVFGDNDPQIPNATMVVKSNSYMFYKERLINKLEPHIPEQYTKLVCMDSDIIFEIPDWVDKTSQALDTFNVIQPFSEAAWLRPDNTIVLIKKMSYAFGIANNQIDDIYDSTQGLNNMYTFHPGFAWAFQREFFRKIGGFYDRGIIGSGDMLFAFNFFNGGIPDLWVQHNLFGNGFFIDKWNKYNANFVSAKPHIGFIPNKAYHLFHGVRENRQYLTRYGSVSNMLTGKWEDQIMLNADGLFEFKNPEINECLLEYFKARNEDIPLEEAERITEESYRLNHESFSEIFSRIGQFVIKFLYWLVLILVITITFIVARDYFTRKRVFIKYLSVLKN
jgi:hypothetical protein